MKFLRALIARKKVRRAKRDSDNSSGDRLVDPRSLPAYGIAEASHYLRIPTATLRSWTSRRPYRTEPNRTHFNALITLPDPDLGSLSFFNLVEAHILHAVEEAQRFPKIPLPRIYSALEDVRKEFDSKHPLTEKRFATEGINYLMTRFQGLRPASEFRRSAIRELIRVYLSRIEYDPAGIAIRFYPFTRKIDLNESKGLVIDPYVSFGRATIRNTGISTGLIAERYRAGDSLDALAQDYGCKKTQIEEAVRSELALAA